MCVEYQYRIYESLWSPFWLSENDWLIFRPFLQAQQAAIIDFKNKQNVDVGEKKPECWGLQTAEGYR